MAYLLLRHTFIDIVIVANWLAQFNDLVLAVIILRNAFDALFHRLNLSSEHVKYLQQQSLRH